MRTRSAPTTTVALLAAALLGGCATTETASPSPSTSDAVADPVDVELPATAAGAAADRLLGLLEPEATGPTPQETPEIFSSAFLEVLPHEQLVTELERLRAGGPYPVTEVVGGDESTVVLRLGSEPPLQMQVVVDADGLVDGFPLAPDTTEDAAAATSLPELDAAMAALGNAQTYTATITGGACETTHSTAGAPPGGAPAPSGSVVKLVVLAALVEEIAAGGLAWDDELTITDDLKSLPMGELQDRPDGTTVTVREAADLMISISDNTATDLLIHAVGRDRVQETLPDLGLATDQLDPLLTTRELFLLAWGAPEARERWADAEPRERRELLTDLPDDLAAVDLALVATDTAWPDGIDWFLSGADICSVLATLTEQSATEAGEPVLDILAINPGLETPEGVDYLGFKGGAVTGVLANAHLMQVDGQWRVFVAQTWGEPTAVTTSTVVPFLQRGLDLTAAG